MKGMPHFAGRIYGSVPASDEIAICSDGKHFQRKSRGQDWEKHQACDNDLEQWEPISYGWTFETTLDALLTGRWEKATQ